MSKPSILRRLFGAVWTGITWLRLALANLLFLLMIAIIYFVYFGGSPKPLPEQAALLLNPIGTVVDEKSPVEPLQTLLGEPSPADHEVLLRDVIESIDLAAADPAINSMVMELDSLLRVGMSRSLEIAQALERFKATGKPVIAVADYFSQDQYFLASYADELILHPLGGVALEGFGLYLNYFAEALEKLSVSIHVFRAGMHKSAMEPFTRNDMADEEKRVNRAWLDDLWRLYTTTVESQRSLPAGAIDAYVAGFAERLTARGGDTARDALDAGLVDRLLSRSESNSYLVDTVGAADEDGLYEAVPFEYYLNRKRERARVQGPDRVAVITAQGTILPGDQPPGMVGGDSLARLINEASSDAGVKAIVLRIATGGGSMFASEIIREQVLAARAAGIPVVVSMGAVAASGGYYIAADADEIWATPATITGSIGVFAAFPTFEGTLARLGVNTDGVGTTTLAGSLRADRALAPELKAALDASVGSAYQLFLEVVASGRGLSDEEVAAAAEGRTWSAEDALELGLVDHLGGLSDAIEAAAAIAELEEYTVQYVEPYLTPSQLFWQQLTERVSVPALVSQSSPVAALNRLAQPLARASAELSGLQDPRHLYFRCLPCAALD